MYSPMPLEPCPRGSRRDLTSGQRPGSYQPRAIALGSCAAMMLLQAKGLLHKRPAQTEPRLQRLDAFWTDGPRAIAPGWYE